MAPSRHAALNAWAFGVHVTSIYGRAHFTGRESEAQKVSKVSFRTKALTYCAILLLKSGR
jgi:hypothetical protein